ncbi:MAG: beta-phosphoglucomutase [Ruminococcaceae bacterium]|nr:beta-phosphoglucomutase [Oscillospiraceae bacterium]
MKGLIFDLDGVLLSTDHFHYLAWKKLADRLGIEFTEKDNERLRGVSRMESLEIILSLDPLVKLSEDEKVAVATEKNEHYREYLKTMTPTDVSDEVRETLASLRKKGYTLAVGSSSKNTRFILERTALTDCFDAIADGNDIKNSKPDPEVFLKAAEFVGLDASVCAVIEDAEAGLEAANAAKMVAIAYASAYGSKLGDVQLEKFSDLDRLFK